MPNGLPTQNPPQDEQAMNQTPPQTLRPRRLVFPPDVPYCEMQHTLLFPPLPAPQTVEQASRARIPAPVAGENREREETRQPTKNDAEEGEHGPLSGKK